MARRAIALLLALCACAGRALGCTPVDYLALSLPETVEEPSRAALRLAYPDLVFSADGERVSADGTTWLDLAGPPASSPAHLLADPTPLEQFTYPYPLTFDLTARTQPWADPGRPRNDSFFRALWFSSAEAARATLVPVDLAPLADARVYLTGKHGVNCQFEAVRAALSPEAGRLSRFFASPGGGFNWRRISGTSRLSPHAFGIAVDINPTLGGYWKWSGAREGAVGFWPTEVPEDLVEAMERHGFIRGGKWHHFDGMHFEFRPEIILYNRIETLP